MPIEYSEGPAGLGLRRSEEALVGRLRGARRRSLAIRPSLARPDGDRRLRRPPEPSNL
ncbi:hypothetical protein OH782_35440 [Streptomyces sp. NBC_01544]|uniref:hypothetical protein n=1 Tax=unclassified Streptomyces TaxID=2593676 RepID=UPI0028C4C657|nr:MULTISPECIES: hypothetical protein [unclassified Streptomyces]WNO63439.1 hypothetical protein RPQ02_06330 [Streptomyces sp. AM2-3-1]WSC68015.1 hypothetical protein OG807_05980 [Streptomyces sp. NBC_01760]